MLTAILSIFAHSLFAQCNSPCTSAPHTSDFSALEAIYCSTDGDNWRNNDGWYEAIREGESCDYCDWYGVVCDENSRVLELDLTFNRLNGQIPSYLGVLYKLEVLRLGANDITGSFPQNVADLTELKEWTMYSNELNSLLPSNIGNLVNLETLVLDAAGFTGNIPTSIGNLAKLKVLNLTDNSFNTIPIEMKNLINLETLHMWECINNAAVLPDIFQDMKQLKDLDLRANKLFGDFPSSLFEIGGLEELLLSNNNYEGNIGDQFGDLKKLKTLSLDGNNYTGSIPEFLGSLDSLSILDLSSNRLTGGIPDTLYNLTKLDFLILNDNELSGQISEKIENLNNLAWLILDNNKLNGPLPISIGELPHLGLLRLHNDDLLGCIPNAYKNLCDISVTIYNNTNLEVDDWDDFCEAEIGLCIPDSLHQDYYSLLSFYQNNGGSDWRNTGSQVDTASSINGWAKDSLYCDWYGVECDSIGNVMGLDLEFNRVSGSFPSHLVELDSIKNINLRLNPIDTITEEIGAFKLVEDIDLSFCSIEGPIPSSLGELEKLKFLTLDYNELTGVIPVSIGNLKSLELLDLTLNNIEGEIPDSITNLSNLQVFELGFNTLTGTLPNDICNMLSQRKFNVLGSNMIGELPESISQLTQMTELVISLNGFSGNLSSLKTMEKLELLSAFSNSFTGEVPEELSNFLYLETVAIGNNSLTGNLPDGFGSLDSLKILNVVNNDLTGSIPADLGDCQVIETLNLRGNNFSGCLDSNLIQLCNPLISVDIDSNPELLTESWEEFCETQEGICIDPCVTLEYQALLDFYYSTNGEQWKINEGWIEGAQGNNCTPCDWYGVKCNDEGKVISIDLDGNVTHTPSHDEGNQLSGALPRSFTNLLYLEKLYLSHNQLEGPVDSFLFEMIDLKYIDLSFNLLSGNLPSTMLGNFYEYLDLSNNELDGTVPNSSYDTFGGEVINLSHNNFEGNLPFIGAFDLYLNNNNLSGTLEEIGNYNFVEKINLSNNNFEGAIPPVLTSLIYASINLSSNDLSGCIPQNIVTYCENNKLNIIGNEKLPWLGQLSQFCATLGLQEMQYGTPCNDGIDSNGTEDIILDDCSCGPKPVSTINLENSFHFYPNPTEGIIHIDSDSSIPLSYSIYDLSGIEYKMKFVVQNSIDISELNPGIYILKVKFPNGQKVARKIVRI